MNITQMLCWKKKKNLFSKCALFPPSSKGNSHGALARAAEIKASVWHILAGHWIHWPLQIQRPFFSSLFEGSGSVEALLRSNPDTSKLVNVWIRSLGCLCAMRIFALSSALLTDGLIGEKEISTAFAALPLFIGHQSLVRQLLSGWQ